VNRLLFFLPLVALVGLIVAFGLGMQRDPKILPSPLVGQPVPSFELASLEEGGPALMSSLLVSDGEPKLLNVFASWCVSCKVEHPLLMRLAGDGVPIYGLDWKDRPEDGRAYLEARGSPFRVVGSDPSGRAGIELGVTGTPETFVIDGRGIIRHRHMGPITAEVWEEELAPMLARLREEAAT
jgi:cytochrome c biogenesis protein CcmG/thiol:disulfide interchange protein DsbE